MSDEYTYYHRTHHAVFGNTSISVWEPRSQRDEYLQNYIIWFSNGKLYTRYQFIFIDNAINEFNSIIKGLITEAYVKNVLTDLRKQDHEQEPSI